ncbi:MAG: class I SAM-dependent methyltransferase [Candidatus Eiseniibacteriota bacterium]|jgi:SAM-dependent methyltransferase
MQRVAPYAQLARDFDRELGAIFAQFERPLLDALLRAWRPPGDRVLDLACGTGRVATYLARRRRLEVVGLDRSPSMVAMARRRSGGGQVRWLVGDMRRFALRRPVGLVTCLFDSLNHLTRGRDVQRTLRCVARHLLPGGRLLFDVNTPYALRRLWPGLGRVIERPDHCAVWRADYDRRHRRARLVADYFIGTEARGYRHVREVHLEKAHHDSELRRWIGNAGLRVRAVGRLYKGRGPRPPCLRRVYLCEAADAGARDSGGAPDA